MRDLHNSITIAEALPASVVHDDTEGTGSVIDLAGYESCEIVVAVGESGDTLSGSTKFDLKLQHGSLANGSDMAAVAAADVLGDWATGGIFATIDAPDEDGTVHRIGYVGGKRYVRVMVDTTGTHSNGTPVAAIAVLGRPRHLGTTA